jgi:aminoglycoside phosphotransferase (APT) family kinase protein
VEVPLEGGRQTQGIVRVGSTVRRPLHARSGYVHAVLEHLAAVGFDGAPRFLGIDERGREILSYVPGEVPSSAPFHLSDARLRSAALLVRRFHGATAGTPLAAGGEVVRHGDLGPHNMVFDGERAVAIIDWDEDVAPGSRIADVAGAVWSCADVCEAEVPVAEQARRVRLMCDAYGCDPADVVAGISAYFARARANHAAHGRDRSVEVFDGLLAWMERNAAALTGRAAP